MVAAGADGACVWAAGTEPVLPDGCAAMAEPAIKLVASSAAANFVNIVFSFLYGAGQTFGLELAPIVEETFTPWPLNAI
jgi:hypothetical protein